MPTYTETFTVGAPAGITAGVLLDVARWPTWTASMREVTPLSPGPLRPGLRVKVRQPGILPATWTVLDVHDHGFAWRSKNPGVIAVATHLVESSPAGCQVTLSVAFSGPMAWLVGLVYGRVTRRYLSQERAGLTAAVAPGQNPSDAG